MKRKLLSIILVIAMLMSMAPTAFAGSLRTIDDGTIDYVTLGASNTNGYGHRGYLPSEVTEDPLAASKADMNVYGYDRKPDNAYPAQIRDALGGENKVNLHQLAISSMRTEELRVLLDDEYYGDDYTEWRFTGGQGWFEIALPGGIDALREEYQNAVKDAELITIDIGWNNFGVYAFNNIKTILADGKYWKAPELDQVMDEFDEQIYQNMKKIALDYLKSDAGMADAALQAKLEMMADVLAYAAVGACYHFDIVLEKIYELNPDATVVSINIQNLADGLVIDFEGTELNLGDLYGKLIEMTDLYRATTSPYADRYLYADAGDVATFLDEIVAWDGDPATLGDDMKDCFDMYDDSLYVRSIVEYMMVGQALSGLFQGFRDIAAEYGLGDFGVFENDDYYTYEFGLQRTPEELLSLDLSKLDLNNPAGDDADVEAYGKAVAKHLKNLRGEGKLDAYDYVFEALNNSLGDQKTGLETQKAGLETQRAGLETQKAELEAQKDNPPTSTTIQEIEEIIAQLEAGIAQIDGGLAQINAGIDQLTQAINDILPAAKAQFDAKLKGIYDTYHNTLNYAYDVVATVVQHAAFMNALEINAGTLNGFNGAADRMMALVVGDFINGAQQKFYHELEKNGVQKTGMPDVPDYVIDESQFEDSALRAILVLAVRYELGNSFYAHPNVEGHTQINDAVLEALANGPTAKDYSDDKLAEAWNWMMDYAQANYPEAYETLKQAADYVGSEEFATLCEELENLYIQLDAATTPEQKAKLADETYKLLTRLQEIAAMATADKVENIDYYVSIGDSTLSGYGMDKYVPGLNNGEGQVLGDEAPVLVAKKLFGEDYAAHFKKLDKGGLRTNDILVWLGLNEYKDDFYNSYTIDENAAEKNTAYYQNLYETEIKKADLITLTLGGGDVSTFIEKQIIAMRNTGKAYALDWTKYFPEADLTEIYGYIDTITQLLDGTLPEIMGVEAEDLAPLVAESFLYGFIGYVNNYSKIVDRIHEINPDAHIALVGYFNTVDDMMMPVTIQGETIQIPIGTMLGMLVETSNANTLSYALGHKEYATYVSISDATTILDEQGIFDYESRLNGLIAQTWLTHAGPEGHKYIADQIYNAITTEYTDEDIAKMIIDQIGEYGKEVIDEFTNANHAVLANCVNTYVALGGPAAAQGTYVEAIAEYTETKAERLYDRTNAEGLAYQNQLAYVMENADAIAEADLITYQTEANQIVRTLLSVAVSLNVPGGSYTSPDWSKYIDEEVIATAEDAAAEVKKMKAELAPYLSEETLAWIKNAEREILAKMTDNEIIDEEVLEEAKPYIESLAYSMVEYAAGVAEAVEAIDTINPDAVIMLIGMYNTLEGTTITLNGETIDLGEYFSYIIEAVDLYDLVYAVVSGNVTFVDISDAPVLENAGNLDIDPIIAFIEKLSSNMTLADLEAIQAMIEDIENWIGAATGNYSADQEYITEQIKSALTVKDHIAGDAAAENAVPATCEDPGSHEDVVYCTVCGKELSRTLVTDPATGHTAGDAVKENTVPATCTEPGSHEDAVYCTVCGEELSRTLVPVEAAGHKYGAWTSLNANEHQRVCATDANHVEKAAHVYDSDLDTICNDCGYERFIGGGGSGSGGGSSVTPPATDKACDGGDDCVSCCTFTDLKAAIGKNSSIWWHEAIDYVISNKLMNGVSDSLFAPDKPTTRAMIVTTLYRIEGSPAVTGDNDYTDVKDDFWYTDAIIWATENGIVNGYGNGEFGPDDVVTREQIAAIFHRYAQYKSVSPSATADLSGYTDADEISTWAVDSMKWANKIGLMEGRSTTTLVPLGDTTRAEMATLLYRWCEEIA